jgi:sulfhydrogenase subunit alpha
VETRAGEKVVDRTTIEIKYLARVEGETDLMIGLDGEPSLQLRIFEPPRFFEGFLVGRKYDEVGDIVSRICGICPVSHMTTAILAIERAMSIEVSEQTTALRRLLCLSQIVASHLVHLYALAMPDYHDYPGMVQMQESLGPNLIRYLRMKEVMNRLSGLIGGRALHPVTHMPGGFTSIPDPCEFTEVLESLKSIRDDAAAVVRDVADFQVPEFHADCANLALYDPQRYAIDEGRIVSDKGLDLSVKDYETHFQESEVPYAFAKQSVLVDGSTLRVGALARLNNKFEQLQDRTKSLAQEAGLPHPSDNPFHNNFAQSLEVVDAIEQCIHLMESMSLQDEDRHAAPRAGEGGAITEAPRGLLYHWYRFDNKGTVEQAKIVTPTSHNFRVIERDVRDLVARYRDLETPQLRLLCEQLVRAYDPCFSCSVH